MISLMSLGGRARSPLTLNVKEYGFDVIVLTNQSGFFMAFALRKTLTTASQI